MKNKTLKLLFILISALLISFLLITNVNAEPTADTENHILTIPCGDTVTEVNLGDEGLNCIDTTGIVHNADRYEIIDNTGTSILTTWTRPIWNNNSSSNYGTIYVNTSAVGQQILTIRFTPGSQSTDSTPKTTELVVKCTASADLQTVLKALGCVLEDGNASINTDNAFTSLDNLTGAQYEAILDAEEAYNNLNDAEKAIADDIMTNNLGMTMAEVLQAAEDGIERLANEFVDATRLNDESVTEDLKEMRSVLSDALELGDKFNELSPRTKAKALAILSDETTQFNSWAEVEEECKKYIDIIDTQLFLTNYIELKEDVLDEEKVLAGEEEWNNLNDNVKELINGVLSNTEGIEKTYPELLLRAKANKFLKDNLTTSDGKTIVEANNSNYQQILDAEDDYNALPDEVKDEVNKVLTEIGKTTYPDLLKFTQALAPTPKTGDMAVTMMIILVVSVLGLGVTFIIKKK